MCWGVFLEPKTWASSAELSIIIDKKKINAKMCRIDATILRKLITLKLSVVGLNTLRIGDPCLSELLDKWLVLT